MHDSRISPKAALVYSMAPGHSPRLTYNQAFQVANYTELFLYAPTAAPSPWPDLSGLQAICDVAGVDCGFGVTPILAVGNETLDVEQTKVFALGYAGILFEKALVSLDTYRSKNDEFISDLVFQRDLAAGRLTNDSDGLREGPAALPAAPEQAVRAAAAANLPPVFELTNGPDGSNIIAAASYTNVGKVETQGAELGLQDFLTKSLQLGFGYSWFNLDIPETPSGQEDLLPPNSPRNQASLGVS